MPTRTPQDRAQVGQDPPRRPYRAPVTPLVFAAAPDRPRALAGECAGVLVRLVLERRQGLPHAANGKPKASCSAAASQIRKEMEQGRSREWQRLLTVALADVADGVPVELVVADFRRAEAIVRAHAPARVEPAASARALAVLHRRETRLECQLDLAQLAVEAAPDDPHALEQLVQATQQYRPTLDAIEATATARLAALPALTATT